MAFMGLIIALIALILLGGMVLLSLIFLIVAIVKRKKSKKTAKVCFILAALLLIVPACIVISALIPDAETVMTREGEVQIKAGWISEYRKYLQEHDVDGLRELVDKHPEMIYYQDVNRVTLLDYGMYNMDVEVMQIALDKGAVFDDPLTYEHLIFFNSFHSFFSRMGYPYDEDFYDQTEGETTDDMLETIAFMIENGAALKYDGRESKPYQNFYEQASEWVYRDEYLSQKDEALLTLIEDALQKEK